MELEFHRVYKMADHIAEVVDDDTYGFNEIDWECLEVSGCLTRFTKTSILGHFCFAMIRLHDLWLARKSPESLDVKDLEEGLQNYHIPFLTFADFIRQEFPEEQDCDSELDHMHDWMRAQEDNFSLLWEKMTDEVVHLLFGNRNFLLNFNLALAEFRKERGDSPSPRRPVPQWAKRAVYFRENGKCALCKKDLSGLIALDSKQHYDHIVPLKSLGVNDPCNIQLLCEKCNLRKAAAAARTSSVYDPWWK